MADNVILNVPDTSGATIATDEVAAVQHQLVKVEFGADGVATMVSAADPLPVTAAALPLPAGAATAANQQTNALTDAQLRAVAVPVSGTVTANLAAGTNNIGDVDVLTLPALVAGTAYVGKVRLTDGTTDTDIRDLANSNALNVSIVDGSGDQITSFGGGTQYTEDAVAAANPVGTAVNLIRQDTPAGLTTTDGDNVAQRGTNFGAGFVQVLTSAGAFVDTFGGGTQYADGAVRGTATGTLAMGDDGTNIQSVKVDAAGELQVDVLTMPAITGTVTANAGTNLNTSLLALEAGGNLAAILADTTNIETAVQLIDDTVATLGTTTYTETTTKGLITGAVRRDADTSAVNTDNEVAPLLVNAIGALKVEVFSGETLAVSLTSTTITGTVAVSATDLDIRNLVFATDKVDVSGSTLAANSGVDIGDVTINNAAGASAVNIQDGGNTITVDGTVAVTGVATETTLASLLTSSQLIDDTIAVLGTDTYTEAASKGQIIGAVRRDANTTLVNTTNEIAPLQVNSTGDLKVAQILALPAGDNNIGNVDIVSGTITTVSTVTNLSQQGGVAISLNTGVRDTGTQRVTIATNDVVPITDNAGSLTVDAPVATPVNVQIGNATLSAGVIDETGASAVDALAVGGGTAHDAVDSGNPVKVGGVAVSGSATPTSVASGDRTRFIANQHGIPYVMGGHPNLIVREYDFGTAAQTDVNLAAAAVAADERIYVTRLEVLCDNANTVAVSARVGFGTANVPAASATGVSGMIASHPGIAAGSGIICGNGSGIIAIGAAGEEPRITTSAATSGNTHVIISYFLIDETP